MSARQSTPRRLLELAESILTRSRRGEITWKEANPTAFFTKVGDYYFQVESEDGDGNHPYRIQIETPAPSGTDVLTYLSTREEPPDTDMYFAAHDWTSTVAELYAEARRSGSSIERALDEMLDRVRGNRPLDDEPPF